MWPTPFALAGQYGSHDSRMASEYWSVFGEATWNVSKRWQLIVGARWHEEDKDARIANSVTVPGASVVPSLLTPATSPSGAAVNGRFERSSAALTWSITPKLRVGEHAMTYLTVARSTKAGGFNNGTGNAPFATREFGDETIHHYEIGARVTPAHRRIELSASAFHTQYDDYQDATFLFAQFAVGNVERVELDGFELAVRAALGERTMLDAAASYVDLEYARHTAGVCYPGRPPDGSLPQSCNLSGERPLNAPPWETRLGLRHTVPVRWGELFGRLDWSWTDRYHATFSADPRLKQDSHHDLSLRIGSSIGQAYEMTLWARNLLGENVVQIASTLNFFNDASWQSFLGEPRSYGVTLRASF
jgi:iron complex outermembrane receptor protein